VEAIPGVEDMGEPDEVVVMVMDMAVDMFAAMFLVEFVVVVVVAPAELLAGAE